MSSLTKTTSSKVTLSYQPNTKVFIGIARHRISVDGKGITTLAGFHGCPLRCKYCLNPAALNPKGAKMKLSPQELFDKLECDDLYFCATNGGVTFGGGEPLLQPDFILQFKDICLSNGKKWRINVETSLNVPTENVEAVEKFTDHWIIDIKDMNPATYQRYTGRSNELVMKNLQMLIDRKACMTVRVPLIPDFNTQKDVERSISKLREMGVTDIERLTYIKDIRTYERKETMPHTKAHS